MPGPFSFVAFAVFPLSSRGLLLALISSTAHEHVPLDPSEVLDLSRMSTKLANRHRQIWRRWRGEKCLSLLITILPLFLQLLTVSPQTDSSHLCHHLRMVPRQNLGVNIAGGGDQVLSVAWYLPKELGAASVEWAGCPTANVRLLEQVAGCCSYTPIEPGMRKNHALSKPAFLGVPCSVLEHISQICVYSLTETNSSLIN